MKHFSDIQRMMDEVRLDSVSFIYHSRKPHIQKDGIRYEILTIHYPENEEEGVLLETIPSYGWRLVTLNVDKSWRERSWRHLREIVEKEIERLEAAW